MKKRIKWLLASICTAIAFACVLVGCDLNNTTNRPTPQIPPDEIKITLIASETVVEFDSLTLEAKVTGSKEKVTWDSSNETVAVVDENGLVTALKAGTTTITASVEGVSATCALTVKNTTIAHMLAFDLETVRMYEGMMKEVNVGVTYKGVVLDGETYGFTYAWELVGGESDVVSIVTESNGATAKFTALKTGEVEYEVVTMARGYEARKTIMVKVLEESVTVGFENAEIEEVSGGFATKVTLGAETAHLLTIGRIYPVVNGVPKATETVALEWSSSNADAVAVESGVIVGKKAGKTSLTATGVYAEKSVAVTLSVSVVKNKVTLSDTLTLEAGVDTAITLPDTVKEKSVEKITVNDSNVIFDAAAEKGSVDGKVVTVYSAGMPAKNAELGKGKVMTVETDKTIYSMNVDVYTMIINDKSELDSWQAIAVDNSVRAGLCIEEQKWAVLSGYFILGNDIEYNGTWKTIIPSNGATPSINGLLSWNKALIQEWKNTYGEAAVIEEDWTSGARGGFQGTFDGQGYGIIGLKTVKAGDGSAFIITLGRNGTIKNLSLIDAEVGSGASLLVSRGQGTVENVYAEFDAIEDNGTYAFMNQFSSSSAVVKNVLLDFRDCNNLTSLTNTKLFYNSETNKIEGIYVLGVTEETNASLFKESDGKDLTAAFLTAAELMTDETHGEVVKAWDTSIWRFNDTAILPVKLWEKYAGDITFENPFHNINKNSAVTLKTNKDAKYLEFSLKEQKDGVSLNGNILSVGATATVGEEITVVATSLIDRETAEITFVIYDELTTTNVAAQFYAETSNDNKVTLKHEDFKAGEVWAITSSGESATVETDGRLTVVLEDIAVSTAQVANIYTVCVKNGTKALNFTNVMAVTAAIYTADDLKGFANYNGEGTSAYAVDNVVAGYYVLGVDNLDCSSAGTFAGKYYTIKFQGVFDGNGKKISNVTVGEGGIFGSLQGTVKNVEFDGVTYLSKSNTGLLGGYAKGAKVQDVTVTITDGTGINATKANNDGVFITYGECNYANVTINASGVDFGSVFGYYSVSGTTFSEVTINASNVSRYGWNTDAANAEVTTVPDGVTFVDTDEATQS